MVVHDIKEEVGFSPDAIFDLDLNFLGQMVISSNAATKPISGITVEGHKSAYVLSRDKFGHFSAAEGLGVGTRCSRSSTFLYF